MLARSTALILSTSVIGALLTPTPATAVGETCQGAQATIVGTGPEIRGTAGDDVIVTGASAVVYAGAGNDVVCVSPAEPLAQILVDSGPGDDLVDTSAVSTSVGEMTTHLGSGIDRYLGGPAFNVVTADGADDHTEGQTAIRLLITGHPAGTKGRYVGRGVSVWSPELNVRVDLRKQKVYVAGTFAADLVDSVRASISAPRATLVGNGEGNGLSARGCVLRIVGGAGADIITAGYRGGAQAPQYACLPRSTVRGGPGGDIIDGSIGRDRLLGNGGTDLLYGQQQADHLDGGSGNDYISAGPGSDVAHGGGGRDVLQGDAGRDTLVGDHGRDRIDGYGGIDRCVGEQERRCER